MSTYDLYGLKSDDLDGAKRLFDAMLSITFDPRESLYQGGDYYFYGDKSGEHFVLKRNLDPFDGDPSEINFPDYKILLYINDTHPANELRAAISSAESGVTHLRNEEL